MYLCCWACKIAFGACKALSRRITCVGKGRDRKENIFISTPHTTTRRCDVAFRRNHASVQTAVNDLTSSPVTMNSAVDAYKQLEVLYKLMTPFTDTIYVSNNHNIRSGPLREQPFLLSRLQRETRTGYDGARAAFQLAPVSCGT